MLEQMRSIPKRLGRDIARPINLHHHRAIRELDQALMREPRLHRGLLEPPLLDTRLGRRVFLLEKLGPSCLLAHPRAAHLQSRQQGWLKPIEFARHR